MNWMIQLLSAAGGAAWALLGGKAKLPSVKGSPERIYFDNIHLDLKCNSIVKAACGYLVSVYNNASRHDSYIGCLSREWRIIHSSDNETMGTPCLKGGKWIFPAESKRLEPLVLIDDKTGAVTRGIKALAEYATIAVDGYIAYADPCRIVGPSGIVVHDWPSSAFNGIVSGMAHVGDEFILAIMDGPAPGIASTKGWKIAGQYPEVAVVGKTVLGFTKAGEVQIIEKGKVKSTIARTNSKPQRARVSAGLCFWITADPDQLWVTNGKDATMLYQFGAESGGTESGSLFNTSLCVVDSKTVVVARSVAGAGFDILKVDLK